MTWLGIAAGAFILLFCFRGYRRGFVKEAVSLMFVVLSIVIVWTINPYVQDYLKEKTSVYTGVRAQCEKYVSDQLSSDEDSDETQQTFIERLPLPKSLRESMAENNNSQVYNYLVADTFADYIADYLATTITNGIAFLLSYLLAAVGIRLVAHVLDIMSRLPVIHGVNRLAGIALGAFRSVIVIWIILLVLTILCNTDLGEQGLVLVKQDPFLSVLYDNNVFVQIFLSIFYGE